ncbi:hypothetical protein FRB99_003978 [Tulasnella sp. 403]|nr:hypothetical protein FRB99_003978 [Tulasnella sp. 403]
MCPMDRRDITKADLIEPPPPPSEDDEASDDEDWEAKDPNDDVVLTPPSSKVKQLISLLKLLPATEKSLVFSQYTSFLDLIELQLQRERIPYVRLDGSLSEQRRTQVIQEFSVPLAGVNGAEFEDDTYAITRRGSNAKGKQKATVPNRRNPVVMLISLKAGALGLNLTVASRVFLMDPWWQSAIEEQAIDRVNRIGEQCPKLISDDRPSTKRRSGQTKEVHVYRLVAADTVETRVLAIQARKQRMINEAFSGTSREANRQRKKSEMLHNVVEVFQPSQ